MTILSTGGKKLLRIAIAEAVDMPDEVMVFCPMCKAFETVCFNNGSLIQTRKFTQYGSHIYHDCGSNDPCRLYMTL